MASDGDSVIFKSPGESNNCGLGGGTISLVAVPQKSDDNAVVRFTYELSRDKPRNDIVTLTNVAGTLSVDGQQRYRLSRSARVPWQPLRSLDATGTRLRDTSGADVSIGIARSGHYFVRLRDQQHRNLFTGTMMPTGGKVYIRDATFTSLVSSYAVATQHDCANWGTAETAVQALQRMQSRIPP